MTRPAPVLAILWECWRLTRTEAVWRLAAGVVLASAVLIVAAAAPDDAVRDLGAVAALGLIVMPQILGWFTVNKLNVGRPGFPFYLLYTRPVRTSVAVGVPMAYQAAVAAALYLVSALLLRITSGYAFPLFAVAAWIAAINMAQAAAHWSTRNQAVQLLGNLVIAVTWSATALRVLSVERPGVDVAPPHLWPTLFDMSRGSYALLGAIGLAAFCSTVVAVGRQRHGDAPAPLPWGPGAGFLDRLAGLFRVPCPTSSATWAQVWFELRARGLPLLAIAAVLAVVNLVAFALSGPIDAWLARDYRAYVPCRADGCFWARPLSMLLAMATVPAVLTLGANAFGIRTRHGRLDVSAFDAIQPSGSGRLAVVKVLVNAVCALVAAIAVGASASLSLGALGQVFGEPLWSVQRAVAGAVVGDQQIALAVAAAVGVTIWVASWAALGALGVRYPRRLNLTASSLLLYGLALAVLAFAGRRGIGPEVPISAILDATSWLVTAALVLATGYIAWRTAVERLLTPRQAWAVVLLSAAFAASWPSVLRAAGLSLSDLPAIDAVRMLSPALLPLTLGLLAPWSYSRVRHL